MMMKALCISALLASTLLGQLALEVEVPDSMAYGTSTGLKVRFVNRGSNEVMFHVPLFAGANAFPELRMERLDGAVFEPYDAPFQSMWQQGLQGSLVELAAGDSKWFEINKPLWMVAAPTGQSGIQNKLPTLNRVFEKSTRDPLPLEPGTYRLRAIYQKAEATVPIGEPNFKVHNRQKPGLWTGRIEELSQPFVVGPKSDLELRIHGPRNLSKSGGTYLLNVTLTNHRAHTVHLRNPFMVSVGNMMSGTANVSVVARPFEQRLIQGERMDLELAPGASMAWKFPLSDVSFTSNRRGGSGRLTDLLGSGVFWIDMSMGNKKTSVRSNSISRYVVR